MSFAKGFGAGMLASAAAAVTVKYVCKHNKKLRRKTGKAAKALSEIMEDIEELIG